MGSFTVFKWGGCRRLGIGGYCEVVNKLINGNILLPYFLAYGQSLLGWCSFAQRPPLEASKVRNKLTLPGTALWRTSSSSPYLQPFLGSGIAHTLNHLHVL